MINHSGEWLSLGVANVELFRVEIVYFLIRLWVHSFVHFITNIKVKYIFYILSFA